MSDGGEGSGANGVPPANNGAGASAGAASGGPVPAPAVGAAVTAPSAVEGGDAPAGSGGGTPSTANGHSAGPAAAATGADSGNGGGSSGGASGGAGHGASGKRETKAGPKPSPSAASLHGSFSEMSMVVGKKENGEDITALNLDGLSFDGDMFVAPSLIEEPNLEVIVAGTRNRRLSAATTEFLNKRVKDTDALPRQSSDRDHLAEAASSVQSRLLNEFMATGICGNNITSSCLYVIALCAEPAGKYAPGALLFICGLLYLFRSIYTEVVAALPVNGGTYNLLLNTTTKGKASAAACLTMLSYVATAVISSSSAMRYVQSLAADLNVVWATVGVLALVALLNILGITESAGVALAIFCFHMATLAVLVGSAAVKAFTDMPVHPDTGDVMLVYNWVDTEPAGGAISGLYFGFSAALLGISGFESSANYVEQQRPGVFPKTLRNMWVAVTLINPTIALLAQCLMPVKDIADQGESGALLSMMGALSAGRWLEVWVIIDAALVLTGAVVSSFVGFTGLVHRMTMDRCLPQVLLATNKWRGTRHWIIIGFWTLTALMVLFTGGQVDIMAGVYTIAFLSVMALFTIGNMLLKTRRASLPTSVHASWKAVITAFLAVTAGLVGNILSRDSLALQGFVLFGAVFVLPVLLMLNRARLLRFVVGATAGWAHKYDPTVDISQLGCLDAFQHRLFRFVKFNVRDRVKSKISSLTGKPLVFFTNDDNPATLTQAIMYILANEQRRWIKFVRVFKAADEVPSTIPATYQQLARCFPELRIDYVAATGEFGPLMVRQISRELHVPATFMFMGSFNEDFPFTFTELGGLRLITN